MPTIPFEQLFQPCEPSDYWRLQYLQQMTSATTSSAQENHGRISDADAVQA